jgi:hypothetical protein
MHTTATEPLKLAYQTAQKKKKNYSECNSTHLIPPQRKPPFPPYTHKTPYISQTLNHRCIYNAENNRTHTHFHNKTLHPEAGTLITTLLK